MSVVELESVEQNERLIGIRMNVRLLILLDIEYNMSGYSLFL